MRMIILVLAILLSPTLLAAQQTPEWYRVYTFDESIIDINITKVVTLFGERGHATFRWSFERDQPLSAGSRIKYRSRLEMIEYDCSDKRYRPLQLTYFDSAGKVIQSEETSSPLPWSDVISGSMTEKLFHSACQLITLYKRLLETAPDDPDDAAAIEKVERLARSFSERMEEKKDFAPLIKEFFAADFLNGYLRDKDMNWLLVLNRDVAAKVPRAELQRYYVALMNFGYLSNLYFASQIPSDSNETISDKKIVPPSMVNLVRNHPYLATYKGAKSNYDSLAENINSVERLRSYTDLMEKLAALFRKKVIEVRAEKKEEYFNALDELIDGSHKPEISVCRKECFGLPEGTKLFQVNVPVFRLQIAEINGEMKIVSAMPYFQ